MIHAAGAGLATSGGFTCDFLSDSEIQGGKTRSFLDPKEEFLSAL